jgi:hypothetical protein
MWTEDQYEKFVDEMTAKYPKMYSDQYGGFAVGPGWWPIIQSLSHHIQTHIDWNNLNAKQRPDLKYKPIEQVVVRQVKEKFGGLRFYYDGGNDIIAGMVTIAEAWADSTCEDCGSPGKKRSGGWIKTLCDHHHEQSEKQRRKDF